MAATYAVGEQPTKRDPLAPGASPGAIQAALLPEDQALFDAAYDAALDALRESPELAALLPYWSAGGASQCCRPTRTTSAGWAAA
jgi:hypothetical protein